MIEVKRYTVKIKYIIENYVEFNPYCCNEEEAAAFALAAFKDTHTEICINPEIMAINSMQNKKPA